MKQSQRTHARRAACATVAALATAALCCLGACAPQQTSDGGARDDAKSNAPAVDVAWSMDRDCGTCHATERGSYDSSACEASQHKDVACAQCHGDEATLAAVHEGKTASDKMPTRLKKTSVEDATCFSCHYGDRAGLVAATDGSVVLTDSEGTERNPHDPEGVAEHEAIACGDCHNMHSDEDIQERAMSECLSCHHEGVFACYTCHD